MRGDEDPIGAEVRRVAAETLRIEVAVIQARIRLAGAPDRSACDHRAHWSVPRHMCLRCGVTALELIADEDGLA